jgi:hypothetical protein
VLVYLDSCRKSENEDPMHKWIGSYNTKRVILIRFFKWLHYPDVYSPKQRNELASFERKPECIQGIAHLKRKEVSSSSPKNGHEYFLVEMILTTAHPHQILLSFSLPRPSLYRY